MYTGSTPLVKSKILFSAFVLVSVVILVPIAVEVILSVARNGGVFSYTIDDAYIHLAISRRIQEGFYGINRGEFAAPASSILWPLLLAIVPSSIPGWDLLPLLINLLSAVVIGWVFLRVLHVDGQMNRLVAICIGVSISISLNLSAVVMSGMEHGLQVALTSVGIWGLIEFERCGQIPPVAVAALIVGPWIRYENLAITIPACVYLSLVGRWRSAALISAVSVTGLAAFSGVLIAHGVSGIPTSIQSKSIVFRAVPALVSVLSHGRSALTRPVYAEILSESAHMSFLVAIVSNLKGNLTHMQSWILLLLAVPIFVRLLRPRKPVDRRLAGLCLVSVMLHMFGGTFDWPPFFFGYEIYIFATVLIIIGALYRDFLVELIPLSGKPTSVKLAGAVAVIALTTIVFHRYANALLTIPATSNFHYLQQMTLARYVNEYWKRPIGLEPLGVAMWTDNYILDYEGLASQEVLNALGSQPPDLLWMDKLAKRHGIGLVIKYWTPAIPSFWPLIGRLRWNRRYGLPDGVQFYATSSALAPEIRAGLQSFAKTLPYGAWLEVCTVPSFGESCVHRTVYGPL